ncbi:hypothetical protein ABZ714_17705 [Streptomyces sp. NPDC006798]|uniref:hypothetical protein n=1 Tax=Streptomyces sp. NPDC006798 TaxID=3155462 RepID=UPI0034021FEB
MRDLIAHAFTWMPHRLLPARGRHRAAGSTRSIPPVPPGHESPWLRPWTGPSAQTAREVFRAPEADALTPEQRERFYATAWDELGVAYQAPAG